MSADLCPRMREREWLEDPGFEIWTNATTPTFWTPSGVLTVAQETTEKYAGSNSCKATRSDGVTLSALQSNAFNVRNRSWFYVAARAKGTAAMANAIRLQFYNERLGTSWDEATQAWISGGSIYRNSVTFDYTLAAGWVPISNEAFVDTDAYRMRLAGYWTAAESLFYDAATIFGPYAKPIARVGLAALTYHGEGFRLGRFR